jgi:deoxyribodipyrimidine photolyase-like uncharacterized protein
MSFYFPFIATTSHIISHSLSNPRLRMLIRTFDKMSDERKNALLAAAEKYLNTF